MPKKGQLSATASKRSKQQRKYNSKPAVKKQRARNNQANREAGTYGNGDGKDIAHAKPKARGKVVGKQSPSKNRSFKRTKTAARKKTKT